MKRVPAATTCDALTAPSLLTPIARPQEVEAFLGRLPVALDRPRFIELILGFPRRYLECTSAAEVVRHYALMNSLGRRAVISSLSRDGDVWRICVVARDRHFLFARLAGALSGFGLDIVSAEAFANANALVLDTFGCVDASGYLDGADQRRAFQVSLEEAVVGTTDVEPPLRERLRASRNVLREGYEVELDEAGQPAATRVSLNGPDCFGLLYLVSRALSRAGCDIEMAYVSTPHGRAHDTFFVTRAGRPLSHAERDALRKVLLAIPDAAAEPVVAVRDLDPEAAR